MSWMELPDGTRVEVFGSGGGQTVADSLTRALGAPVPLLGQIPLETKLRECGDSGTPIVLADPEAASAKALLAVADRLTTRARGLAGMSLNITPVRR
jgi:ATP-binding protein involved in chromosome partitioning